MNSRLLRVEWPTNLLHISPSTRPYRPATIVVLEAIAPTVPTLVAPLDTHILLGTGSAAPFFYDPILSRLLWLR